VAVYLDDLESTTGYRVAEHRLEIAGLCPDCRREPPTASLS
jgi:Fe2+ or Zn2+ uptake regulation protein